jgi:hypothetical protein
VFNLPWFGGLPRDRRHSSIRSTNSGWTITLSSRACRPGEQTLPDGLQFLQTTMVRCSTEARLNKFVARDNPFNPGAERGLGREISGIDSISRQFGTCIKDGE